MELSLREKDKLLLFTAALLASAERHAASNSITQRDRLYLVESIDGED
jgi:urease gamma subunit